MSGLKSISVFAVLLLGFCGFGRAAWAAAVLRLQPPCQSCASFNDTDEPGQILRSFTYEAPSPGRSLVTFHGDLTCVNLQGARGVVDLSSQIVLAENAVPSPNGPAGLRHGVVLEPFFTNEPQSTETFNLSSRRVLVHDSAGSVTIYFKTQKLRMDPNTFCNADNTAFSVVFFPKNSDNGLIAGQSPCTRGDAFCTSFTGTGDLPPVRSFSFDAPGKGSALVRLHGSLFCANGSTAHATIDLDSAIVTSGSDKARPDRPGGLKHAIVLEPLETFGTSDSFSLASTRVFEIGKRGRTTYHFVITPRRMDAGTTCYVYNAAFSVIFVRTPGPFEIRSEKPCATEDGWCDAFGSTGQPPNPRFRARADRRGRAELTFHGSVVCQNAGSEEEGAYLTSQILPADTDQTFPSASGPGGLRYSQQLEPAAEGKAMKDTFNLASTRIASFPKAETKTVQLLLSRNIFPKERCFLYNAAFSSLFVPD